MADTEPVGQTIDRKGQFGLLGSRRLLPLFVTQFFGSFNDSVYKSALLLIFVYSGIASNQDVDLLNNLAAALFILPFFLFSATAGVLADRYDKAMLVRRVKAAEILVAVLIAIALITQNVFAMLFVLFLLGVQSTFFGPIKYALLPQHLHPVELTGGNAMVAMGTFVAILIGTVIGGIVGNPQIVSGISTWLSGVVVITAVLGFIACWFIPASPPSHSGPANWNPFTESIELVRLTTKKRAVFRSVLGVSWFWLVGSVLLTQFPNLTEKHLYGDGSVATLLLTAFTVAVAMGALVCERLSGRKIEIGLVPIGAAGMSICGIDAYFTIQQFTPVPLQSAMEFLQTPGVTHLMVDLCLLGVFGGVFVIPMQALIQNRTEPGQVARVIAANNILNSGAMVLGALISILWLSVLDYGIPSLVLLMAVLTSFVAAYIFATVPEFVMRFIVWLIGHSMYRVKRTGLDRVPDKGAAVLVANHVSFVDFMLIGGAVHRPLRFVMHRYWYDMKLIGWVAKIAGAVPINSKDEDPELYEEAFKKIREGLSAGEIFCIFPEGRLTPDGEMQEFKHGIDRILRETPVPVIPLGLGGMWGSYFSKAEGIKKLSKRVRIDVGHAIPPEQVTVPLLFERVAALRGGNP